ncbi:unannotated protein [freshwater metagenome]|uniref:Unannotated protein n=1 Tax=freshwater metagenome TaxID=449393 RepID=A0A6J7ITF0_9ZZZZ|nr:hypothetical protein [Actinomycetota bacterium]
MKRVIALALSFVTGAGLAMSMQAPASAGDVPPIVVIYGAGKSVDKGLTLIAQVPGSDMSVPVSAKTGVNLAASSSTDGRVLVYLSLQNHGKSQQLYLMIRKDGVLLRHIPFGVGAILPSVSADGSIVLAAGPNGLKAFDVKRQRWSAFCTGCPTTNFSSAAISPDRRKVAMEHKDVGIQYMEIYRVSDGRRLARTTIQNSIGNPAWNAASDTIAYVDNNSFTGLALGGIRTLTTSGVVADTKFISTSKDPMAERMFSYTSPTWINNAVWAIRLAFGSKGFLATRVVTAKNWNSAPRAFGGSLYSGNEFWRLEVLGFVGWSAALPTPAH